VARGRVRAGHPVGGPAAGGVRGLVDRRALRSSAPCPLPLPLLRLGGTGDPHRRHLRAYHCPEVGMGLTRTQCADGGCLSDPGLRSGLHRHLDVGHAGLVWGHLLLVEATSCICPDSGNDDRSRLRPGGEQRHLGLGGGPGHGTGRNPGCRPRHPRLPVRIRLGAGVRCGGPDSSPGPDRARPAPPGDSGLGCRGLGPLPTRRRRRARGAGAGVAGPCGRTRRPLPHLAVDQGPVAGKQRRPLPPQPAGGGGVDRCRRGGPGHGGDRREFPALASRAPGGGVLSACPAAGRGEHAAHPPSR
jgi:hypothetical protein